MCIRDRSNGYPPYNIVQHNENEFSISLAVAGFSMEDITVTKDKNTLSIEGKSPKTADEEKNYLHRGVAARSFNREFTLADYVEVDKAELKLGMLNILLKREVPEELQPRKISIVQA